MLKNTFSSTQVLYVSNSLSETSLNPRFHCSFSLVFFDFFENLNGTKKIVHRN